MTTTTGGGQRRLHLRQGPISFFSTRCSREKNLLTPAAAGSFSLDATSGLWRVFLPRCNLWSLATRRRLGRRGDSFRHALSFCGVSCRYEEFTKTKKKRRNNIPPPRGALCVLPKSVSLLQKKKIIIIISGDPESLLQLTIYIKKSGKLCRRLCVRTVSTEKGAGFFFWESNGMRMLRCTVSTKKGVGFFWESNGMRMLRSGRAACPAS